MSKRDDARIAKLAKKNAEKVVPPKRDRSHQFDPTLRKKKPEDEEPETARFFKEMKRREF